MAWRFNIRVSFISEIHGLATYFLLLLPAAPELTLQVSHWFFKLYCFSLLQLELRFAPHPEPQCFVWPAERGSARGSVALVGSKTELVSAKATTAPDQLVGSERLGRRVTKEDRPCPESQET